MTGCDADRAHGAVRRDDPGDVGPVTSVVLGGAGAGLAGGAVGTEPPGEVLAEARLVGPRSREVRVVAVVSGVEHRDGHPGAARAAGVQRVRTDLGHDVGEGPGAAAFVEVDLADRRVRGEALEAPGRGDPRDERRDRLGSGAGPSPPRPQRRGPCPAPPGHRPRGRPPRHGHGRPAASRRHRPADRPPTPRARPDPRPVGRPVSGSCAGGGRGTPAPAATACAAVPTSVSAMTLTVSPTRYVFARIFVLPTMDRSPTGPAPAPAGSPNRSQA